MSETISVLLVDDHHMFITGLIALLTDIEGITVLGTASNGEEAIELVKNHPEADIMIMDVSMPTMDGIDATKELHRQKLSIPILALTQNNDSGTITRATKAGVSGYILKTAHKDEFVQAIRTIVGGETYFSQSVKDTLFFSLAGHSIPEQSQDLTNREKEILCLIVMEKTTNEIAEELFISPNTVESHRKNLIRKLGVRNVAGLVRYAIEHGLIEE